MGITYSLRKEKYSVFYHWIYQANEYNHTQQIGPLVPSGWVREDLFAGYAPIQPLGRIGPIRWVQLYSTVRLGRIGIAGWVFLYSTVGYKIRKETYISFSLITYLLKDREKWNRYTSLDTSTKIKCRKTYHYLYEYYSYNIPHFSNVVTDNVSTLYKTYATNERLDDLKSFQKGSPKQSVNSYTSL